MDVAAAVWLVVSPIEWVLSTVAWMVMEGATRSLSLLDSLQQWLCVMAAKLVDYLSERLEDGWNNVGLSCRCTCRRVRPVNAHIYYVLERLQSAQLRQLWRAHRELDPLGLQIYDTFNVVYFSTSAEDCARQYREYVLAASKSMGGEQLHWRTQSVHMARSVIGTEIHEGLVNQEVLSVWSARDGRIYDRGTATVVANGSEGGFVA